MIVLFASIEEFMSLLANLVGVSSENSDRFLNENSQDNKSNQYGQNTSNTA